MPDQKPRVKPVKLICGVLFSGSADMRRVDSDLEGVLGRIDGKSPIFDFEFTEYYTDEMGSGLKKLFYSFERLVMPDSLADIKHSSIAIEFEYSKDSRRTVNLDPGYLEESKLVLASTKNFSHRIYLRDNIWAEVTLSYANDNFTTHAWTYPDYASDLAFEFFRGVRKVYAGQLKGSG